jgi:hypothetical protein
MGYTITHSLANGLTANLSVSRPGVYAVYGVDGKFITYAKNLKAAKEFANNYVAPVSSEL